jgi:putative membrane protein
MLLVATAACAKKGDTAADSARVADSIATHTATAPGTVAATDSAANANATSRGGWTPASVLGFTTAANSGEIAEAKLAIAKATNPAVKAFARELLADHQAMLKDGNALATKLSVTADTLQGDAHDLLNGSRDELKDLTDKAAGADWDATFIDKEIDGHQKVLDKLQDASKNSNDADLRAALEKASGKVQQHLTKAQDIKANKLKK